MIQIPQVSTLEALQIAISDGAKMLLTTKEWARRVPKCAVYIINLDLSVRAAQNQSPLIPIPIPIPIAIAIARQIAIKTGQTVHNIIWVTGRVHTTGTHLKKTQKKVIQPVVQNTMASKESRESQVQMLMRECQNHQKGITSHKAHK